MTDTLPGFGFREPDGSFSGFDIEFCKAIAAAVLGDDAEVEFVAASSSARFELLSAGEVDLLSRVTTITAERDASRAVDFAQTTFYDGQGFVVHADSDIYDAADMGGATICVAAGTTTEQNLDDFFNEQGLSYTPLSGEGSEPQDQFVARRCDVFTSDKSGLAARIASLPNSDDYRFLPLTISKEPLAPGVRDYDSDWKDVVSWVVWGLINAEELGVTSANVDAWAADPPNTAVARLLGVPFEGGETADLGFAVDPQFIQRALRAVGKLRRDLRAHRRAAGDHPRGDAQRALHRGRHSLCAALPLRPSLPAWRPTRLSRPQACRNRPRYRSSISGASATC